MREKNKERNDGTDEGRWWHEKERRTGRKRKTEREKNTVMRNIKQKEKKMRYEEGKWNKKERKEGEEKSW